MNIVKCSLRTSIILTVIPCPKGMCKVRVKDSRSFTHFDKTTQIHMDSKQETNKVNFDTDSPAPDGLRGAVSSDYSLQNLCLGAPSQQESIAIYQHPSFFNQNPCRLPEHHHNYYWHSLYSSWCYYLANPLLSPFLTLYPPQNSFRRYFHRPHDEVVRVPIPGVEDTAIMSLRRWEKLIEKPDRKPGFIFTLMSYNVLAQDLLQWHPHLYKHHDPRYLTWEKRWTNLLTEIQEFDPDILCLQEVQESHIREYYSTLESLGYQGVYKKRTGQRTDGCAIYYKTENVALLEYVPVEFYQKNVPILNRDNVGIVAKFAPKLHPTREFVVATTHLLYNPRRRDVRMAQMQVFLSEIERISFKQDSVEDGHRYLPILITGDFNTPPNSDLYNFMVEGKIKYDNMPPGLFDNGSKVLVTSVLGISDTCQHVDLLRSRQSNKQPFNSEMSVKSSLVDQTKTSGLFKTGKLSHHFAFKSVYNHGGLQLNEATTNQDGWITVDYIFYRYQRKYTDERLQLLARCRLPTKQELGNMTIPNQSLGSDHLSLAAKFKLLF
nr:unnamed protein product [Callosobruchus analis]